MQPDQPTEPALAIEPRLAPARWRQRLARTSGAYRGALRALRALCALCAGTAMAVAVLGGARPAWGGTALSPSDFVVDEASALTPTAEQRLETDLRDYQARTGNHVAVVVIAATPGNVAVRAYGQELLAGLGTSSSTKVVMVLTTGRHDGAIVAAGPGQALFSDDRTGAILAGQVLPRLEADDPNEAVLAGEQAIRGTLGDTQTVPTTPVPTIAHDDDARHVVQVASIVATILLLSALVAVREARSGLTFQYDQAHGWQPLEPRRRTKGVERTGSEGGATGAW